MDNVAVANDNGGAVVLPRGSARLVAAFEKPDHDFGSIRGLACSQDARFIITNSSGGKPWVWDMPNRKPLYPLHTPGGPGIAVTGVFVQPEKVVTGGEDNKVIRWKLSEKAQESVHFSGCAMSVSSVDITPGGELIMAGATDTVVRAWRSRTGEQLPACAGHMGWVMSVVFLPGGSQGLSASVDRSVRVWDLAKGKEIRPFVGHQHEVHSVARTEDGTLALSSGKDGTIRLWEVDTGKELQRLHSPKGHPILCALSADGLRALSTERGGFVLLWDLTRGAEVCRFRGSSACVEALAFTPGQEGAITGSDTLRLWELPALG
jgi:WD40 repeat protein